MYRKLSMLLLVTSLMITGAAAVFAQEKKEAMPEVSGFQAETIGQLDAASKKLIALAEAMPEKAMMWRPDEGVRSSSEVFMHVAQANYFIVGLAGAEMPKDLPEGMEKITNKADIVAHLKKSFEHTTNAIKTMSDEDLDAPIKLFGQDSTKRGVLLLLSVHSHEHLGQLIAYGRTNKIKPPWAR